MCDYVFHSVYVIDYVFQSMSFIVLLGELIRINAHI